MGKLGVVLRWSWVCVGLLQVGACGKTEDAGAGDADASDDASRPLADLSDAEVSDVCEEVWQLYEDVTPAYERGICVVESAESSDGAECEAAVDECVEGLEIVVTSVDECAESLDFTGCEATVAELDECLAAQRERVEQIAALQSCEDALEDGVSEEESFDEVPACERLVDRCPSAFEEPSEPGEPGEDEDEPYVIEGSVDGKAVEFRPSGRLALTQGVAGESWSLGADFEEAEVWLWGEGEGEVKTGQGLLRMRSSGTEASSWLCLDTVKVEDGTEVSTWESNSLSMLPQCTDGDRQPLELTFASGDAVSGTFQGEAVEWVSRGYDCYETCRFEFGAGDEPWSGRDRWILEVDTSLEYGVSKEFEHATLIHPSGTAAVACGGGGTALYGEDDEIQIVVDALAPLSDCPGTPVDGELRGTL